MKIYDKGEYTLLVGEKDFENTKLIKEANEKDIWFHLYNHPSPHVIAKINTNEYERSSFNDIIYDGALLVKQHSKLKNFKKVTIMYTQIKNVKCTDKLGEVYLKKTPLKIIV